MRSIARSVSFHTPSEKTKIVKNLKRQEKSWKGVFTEKKRFDTLKTVKIEREKEEEKRMDFMDVLSLFGGLALFLLGMDLMSKSLEKKAGGKLKQILESLEII